MGKSIPHYTETQPVLAVNWKHLFLGIALGMPTFAAALHYAIVPGMLHIIHHWF